MGCSVGLGRRLGAACVGRCGSLPRLRVVSGQPSRGLLCCDQTNECGGQASIFFHELLHRDLALGILVALRRYCVCPDVGLVLVRHPLLDILLVEHLARHTVVWNGRISLSARRRCTRTTSFFMADLRQARCTTKRYVRCRNSRTSRRLCSSRVGRMARGVSGT